MKKCYSSHRKLQDKFNKLLLRSNRHFQSGIFAEFSYRKKKGIYKRLKRYANRLSLQVKCTAAGFAIALATALPAQGQMFQEVDPVNNPFIFSENPLSHIELKGGSNATFGDMDGDGDLDIFLGESASSPVAQIYYMENIGDADTPVFADTISQPFGLHGWPAKSFPSLVDIDGDNDLDMFIGSKLGKLNFYENIGSEQSPSFILKDHSSFGIDFPYDVYDVNPSFVDIDNDGDVDLFLNGYDSALHYFENQGTSNSPSFAAAESYAFGLSEFGYYYNSSFTFADLDKDGDFDFLGSFGGDMIYHENVGTPALPDFSSNALIDPFNLLAITWYDTPCLVDLDNDGHLDYFSGNDLGTFTLKMNEGSGSDINFMNSEMRVSINASATMADLDNDSDLDAFVGDLYGNIYYYENIGDAQTPVFENNPNINPFGIVTVVSIADPVFVDINGDGDLDLFLGNEYGWFNFLENIGDAEQPLFEMDSDPEPFGLADPGNDSKISFVDLDNDGDLDALSGNSLGNFVYYENVGDVTEPLYTTHLLNPFGLSDAGFDSAPDFLDADNDGDWDMICGTHNGEFVFFENQGTATSPQFAISTATDPFGLYKTILSPRPRFFDIDNDGDADAIIGGREGNLSFFENTSAVPSAIADLAPKAAFAVFPNPTSEFLNIKGVEEKNGVFTLSNAKGDLVELEAMPFSGELKINISALPAGVYFPKISWPGGVAISQPIIVQSK